METVTTSLLLSRIRFAFTISFHIIFPAFTIAIIPRYHGDGTHG